MLFRLIIFKVVLAVLVIGSAFGLAIRDGVNESLRGGSGDTTSAARIFRQYPLSLGLGCVAVAALVTFGDLLLGGRNKGVLPTYTDEEFLAKFGGNADAQRPPAP
jgi:hypothetical protein